MNDKWYEECSVVAYPREIRFLHIDGSAINYHVDNHISDYINKLQEKAEDLECKNRNKDIENLQLQNRWDSLREWLEENESLDDYCNETTFTSVLDKMNELEGKDNE